MLILLFGIGLIILLIGIGFYILDNFSNNYRKNYDSLGFGFSVVGIILSIIFGVALLITSAQYTQIFSIDERLAIYQEENKIIEEQISTIVSEYKNYESEIFKNTKPESITTLIAKYPELKSDTLVQKQIEIYVNNNNKIKELKIEQANYIPIRWWLFFNSNKEE